MRSALMGLLRSCFARTQTWPQAGKYVNALASDLPSYVREKTGHALAGARQWIPAEDKRARLERNYALVS